MGTSADEIIRDVQDLYLSDGVPWIVGYSGGKDSTATLQIIWKALQALPLDKRVKPVHVISTDTLVENPVIAKWVEISLNTMAKTAEEQLMPIHPHRLTPEVENRYWVCLIGRGYPAPWGKFRWCTDRLKISTSEKFLKELSEANGEAILALGQRRGESIKRDGILDKFSGSTRDRLSRNRNQRLPRVWVYLPIEDWTSDDVWEYLVTEPNPWGINNRDLLDIYRGATQDAECPLVVDTSTPSCGDSRFGCYVCTMVAQDKSMAAMIQNDEQKQWMQPMLDYRNTYLASEDRDVRDFRKMDGSLQLFNGRLVHGPYTQEYRKRLLTELLQTQKHVQEAGKTRGFTIELISLDELDEIRRIWVSEKGEVEDLVPDIYESVYGTSYPGKARESFPLGKEDLQLLHEVCDELGEDVGLERYAMTRNLLAIHLQSQQARRRSKLLDSLEKILQHHAFSNEDDALAFAIERDKHKPMKADEARQAASTAVDESDFLY